VGDVPKIVLFSKRALVGLVVALFGWAGARLYVDQKDGRLDETSIVSVAVVVCLCSLMLAGIYWYANRPEREDKQ
jgi:hypothetical protein